ncbi:MAG: hypothetical protein E6Q88_03345 [Lysobacteraceae bacterium]|nr:MAG: hypothetical protein E6Q88_03345 [Xanthomonadaceae bacterium]
MKKFAMCATLLFLVTACGGDRISEVESVRREIQAALDRSTQATFNEDIEAYMAELPPDFTIKDESGEEITREKQKENILRDWSVILRTLHLVQTVDSVRINNGVAIVETSQRWEREMLRPDKSGTDIVLTTQRHRETWKQHNGKWYGYDIVELGGEIFINGQPYKP